MEGQSLSTDQQIISMESYAHMMLTYTQHNEVNIRFRTVCTCETCEMVRRISLSDMMLRDPNYQGFKMFFDMGGSMEVYLNILRKAQTAVETNQPADVKDFLRSLFGNSDE